jgi:hypothetical protein
MAAKLIKRGGYSDCVRVKLDIDRPKYNEAVKSIAAFAPNERKFNVLVSHLDAACEEVRDTWSPGTPRKRGER